ncbi:hypothetical protein C5167_030509 [Papaver somniferum]|uniref:UDP-glycosyltransferase 87A1-like n=1 Tax=Papaver somniferum TaxID=3469 RepID=UPI000E6F944C|nr:UDP-glycosyltransferase 87A1-like [Papaver somniferum]RZC86429.1 hypothetical protein C5167_030509 [Papaver somniferum]
MESSSRIKRRHVVAMPFPGRGHINPMMNFCKLLTTKFSGKDDIRITFVVTEEWIGFLESSSTESTLPAQIQLRSIPNVIPSELVRGLDHAGFLEAVYTKMEAPFEQFLDQLQQNDDSGVAVTAIITDTLLPCAVFAGSRRNIPVASFWPMSASVFSIFYHVDLLAQNGHYPIDFSSGLLDELIDYIPGVSPIRLADLPPPLDHSREQTLRGLLAGVSAVRKAKCLLITTHHELEPQVTETLMEILPVPVYPVGPSIPFSISLADGRDTITKMHKHVNMEEHKYLKWLDCQPDNSVLFVSFGSFLSTSSEQMEEILAGLLKSGVRYLLVLRGGQDETTISAADLDSGNEMANAQSCVVPWCEQLRVLCHSSVGGFWTHCGWNSTLEGVYAGVPMLTFPVGLDQPTNSKLIVDDWENGMKVMKEVGANRLVKRDAIAMTVKKFMNSNGDNEESRKMRTAANELKESCRKALAKGGSSDININEFIKTVLKVA